MRNRLYALLCVALFLPFPAPCVGEDLFDGTVIPTHSDAPLPTDGPENPSVPPSPRSGYLLFTFACIAFAVAYAITYRRSAVKVREMELALEAERQMTEHRLQQFTNISNEFKAPLTLIHAVVESLAARNNRPAAGDRLVATLEHSSQRLRSLLDRLSEFRDTEARNTTLNLQETEAVGFLREIYGDFLELAAANGIEYSFAPGGDEYSLVLDREKMDRIACGLLSNAFENTPAGGKIRFGLYFSPEENTFTLSVEDSGARVPDGEQDRLFKRYAKPEPPSKRCGLSLLTVSELASSHFGYPEYSASPELGGACFSVSIPLTHSSYEKEKEWIQETSTRTVYTSADDTPGTEDTLPVLKKPLREYRILVIEDEAEIREIIDSQLGCHFTILSTDNGTDGLAMAVEQQPDLVLCDLMMPGLNGFEVVRSLKDNFDTSHIPAILLTGHVSDEYKLKGEQAGADAYIGKPFSIKYLIASITKFIRQRELLQEKFSTEPGSSRPRIDHSERDRIFFNSLHDIIEQNIRNPDLSVDVLMKGMGMSRNAFYQKVKGITGQTPNDYLRTLRLKKAAGLFADPDLNVSEVAYQVGFDDPLYFSKCFKANFGKTPTQYRNELLGKA